MKNHAECFMIDSYGKVHQCTKVTVLNLIVQIEVQKTIITNINHPRIMSFGKEVIGSAFLLIRSRLKFDDKDIRD